MRICAFSCMLLINFAIKTIIVICTIICASWLCQYTAYSSIYGYLMRPGIGKTGPTHWVILWHLTLWECDSLVVWCVCTTWDEMLPVWSRHCQNSCPTLLFQNSRVTLAKHVLRSELLYDFYGWKCGSQRCQIVVPLCYSETQEQHWQTTSYATSYFMTFSPLGNAIHW